jgi:chromosome segregation protein
VEDYRAKMEKEKQEVASLAEAIENAEEEYGGLKKELRESVARQNHHQHEMTAADERRNQLQRQYDDRAAELEEVETRLREETAQHEEHRANLGGLHEKLDEKELHIEQTAEKISQIDQQQQQCGRETTEAKVELAKSEERLENLKSRLRQFEESRAERDRVLREHRETLARLAERIEQSQRTMLRTTTIVAELYLRKEALADETARLTDERALLGAERTRLTADIQKVNAAIRKLEGKIHQTELGAGDIRHERTTLANKMREDYSIEMAELAHEHELTDEEIERRDEVEKEINECRQRIALLGNVNLDALERLEELDERYQNLSGQFEDLTNAKNELLKIVERINNDSRRLFFETLEVVRTHFQQLFRDLFGGGQADIVLEDEENALESGIEIVARPPGKEPRNISLLSGGEKTMTCVALLLAIFRSRPSPFCVLDEVDAALDEANIGRFTGVLQEFLKWTQFIIVSHSKKTMTCANSIYGVTMQESGISKQVSVRFEDVSEDGHIRPSAFRKEAA